MSVVTALILSHFKHVKDLTRDQFLPEDINRGINSLLHADLQSSSLKVTQFHKLLG